MRPGGGHAKGSAFERKIARLLSKAYYGKEGYLWRRPGSEQRSGQPNLHTGDVVPLGNMVLPKPWTFHVECKAYKRDALRIYNLITDTRRSPIDKFFTKAFRTKRPDLMIVLVVKENKRNPMVFMHWEDAYGHDLGNVKNRIVFDVKKVGTIVGFDFRLFVERLKVWENYGQE